ncbi:MAG TPA: helix-turn-helix transcriptional regulator [Gammaproteobacteria bacterium]|nr:helix-turn-helix transcriptional regulator [Gammaproteobacteria bacterium]
MATRRDQVKEFLKSCRARLTPADVGLRGPSRRRTPGLRREDVAALAGVSVTWYTWLEQGRDINVSAEVLERISSSLRLSQDERDYLFSLVHGRPAPRLSEPDKQLSETLWRTIQYLPVPALVMTLRWDILAWNCLVTKVFRDYGQIPPSQRNLLRILLSDPKYQRNEESFAVLAKKLLAKFRVDFSQYAGDAAFEELIAELRRVTPDFDAYWRDAQISSAMRGSGVIQNDAWGDLTFEYSSYIPEGSSFLRLLMFVPADAKTAEILAGISTQTACVEPPEPARRIRSRSPSGRRGDAA